jgi:signal transduction histidine kinase
METKAIVLVIDDEQGIRDMLSFNLSQDGYVVLTAQNGEEGIQKVRENKIDIIITDIKMPVMDGITVLGKVKEINPEIEVIVATGYGTLETAIECMKKGACDYINKPFDINELSTIVTKAFETRQLKSQLVSLKKLDVLKNEFLSTISHELRTPLMAISGATELLINYEEVDSEEKLGSKLDKNKELLEMIERQTKKVRSLVDTILDFTKMEAGFWQLKIQEVSARKIMDNAVKGIISLAENKRIEIISQISLDGASFPSEDIMINCDFEQILRVLTNLLSNSIKYTDESGKISVRFEKTGTEIKFVVEDNGKGIAKEYLQKVFDRFYRVDQSLTREQSGVGLGLSICWKIIGLHSGKIWAESEGLGKGSKFIFEMPIIQPH